MDEQAQASERRLALQAGHEIVRQLDPLERLAEHELARVQHERLVVRDGQQLGQVRLSRPDVDVRIAVVAKDAEAAVQVQVDRGRLQIRPIVGLDLDPAGLQGCGDVAVGEHAHLTVAPLSRWA